MMADKELNENEMEQVSGGEMVLINGEWKRISPEEAARREAEARRRLIDEERRNFRNQHPELADAYDEYNKRHYTERLAERNQNQ